MYWPAVGVCRRPAGYCLMRIVDAALAFPTILFALLLAMTMGQGLRTLMIAMACCSGRVSRE